MNDGFGFSMHGGPIVARGPKTFHVEVGDPLAAKSYYENPTQARRSQAAPWRPIGDLRREDLHLLLDEWLNAMGSA
jgi:hypothetical protein